ncbi:MAG: helix-turn-helix transcriptional regulator [Myxococcota bacterium]
MLPRKPTNQSARHNTKTPLRETVNPAPVDEDSLRLVRLNGLSVRRRRHEHGWSPRKLAAAIEKASFQSSGLRKTLTPSLIKAIEERSEPIPYQQLWLLADGLGCDPVDLVADDGLGIAIPSDQRSGP